jgi:predicted DNA-binding transcriptional regulator YafY
MQRFWTFGLYVSAEMLMGKLGERRKNPPIFSRGSVKNLDTREQETLRLLRRALLDRNTIRFCYHARYSNDEQGGSRVREANPYCLAYWLGAWHLVAYCHMRQDMRNFRLDRMEVLELLPRTFTRAANFQMYQRPKEQTRNITVRVLFDREIARWVREGRSYFATAEEETEEGLLVTLMIRQQSDILQWLLSWGSHVKILEPDTLRERLAEEAQAMLHNYQNVGSSRK